VSTVKSVSSLVIPVKVIVVAFLAKGSRGRTPSMN